MERLKIFIVLLVASFLVLETAQESQTTRFKQLFCLPDNKTIKIDYCRVRVYSRTTSAFVVKGSVTELVKPFHVREIWGKQFVDFQLFQVKFLVSYRYGTIFREVVNVPPIEWCGLMDGKESNPFAKMIVDISVGSAPALFHPCPYNVSQVCSFSVSENSIHFNFPGELQLQHHPRCLQTSLNLPHRSLQD
jgi:hypothetical protein